MGSNTTSRFMHILDEFEQRVNLGNPGIVANRNSYSLGQDSDIGSTIDTVSGNADLYTCFRSK